ncbi:MAG: NAD(+)/NADH kinase [Tissierellia bacterium]|nr:NAD(+)/NADH kinase [Tissierellia bacterium]
MTKKINIFSNHYDISEKVTERLIQEFKLHGYEANENFSPDADYNVVIGGDGTFIKACHDSDFSDIPFIGINTGHLGFYQEVPANNVELMVSRLINKEYQVQDIKLIDCSVFTEENSYNFLSVNEIVLKAKYTNIIHFNMYVNDILLQSFAGDGVIFSTPSGSTAYNLSAGGAMLYQALDGFQITPMAPIRSSLFRSLDKSLVVPSNTQIKLITRKREETFSSLGVDGMLQEFEDINYINITMSDKTIKKLVFDENWYWKNIKEKFI